MKKKPFQYFPLVLLLFFFLTSFCSAQDTKFNSSVEGQFSLSTNGKALFTSIGGVSLKFIFEKFNLGISMGPAIKFENIASELNTIPVLGVGPQFYFLKDKRFTLNFMAYYIGSKKIWTQSAGIGYVLTKPR